MATWTTFRAAVAAAVSAALPSAVRVPANNDGPAISWTDDRRPFGGRGGQRLLLGIVSTRFDHDRDSALAEGGQQELSSMCTITVQVTAESNHDPAFGAGAGSASPGDALWLIEQVRLGLRRVVVADALREAECPIVGWPLATVSRSYPADGRVISAHSFDVSFRTVFDFDTSEDDAVGQIEHIVGEGEGDLDGADISVDDPTPDV